MFNVLSGLRLSIASPANLISPESEKGVQSDINYQ